MEKDSSKGTTSDRRKLGRVPFTINLALTTGGRTMTYSETHDISTGGIFAVTDDPMEVGTMGDFVIRLGSEDAQGIEIKGGFEVVSHSGKDGLRGMGIHFMEIDEESSIHLYNIVRYNQPVR
ncbi:MAG: PilZ domain-containing protein [Nitrospinota bacterium]